MVNFIDMRMEKTEFIKYILNTENVLENPYMEIKSNSKYLEVKSEKSHILMYVKFEEQTDDESIHLLFVIKYQQNRKGSYYTHRIYDKSFLYDELDLSKNIMELNDLIEFNFERYC